MISPKLRGIALIAHDGKKEEMVSFAEKQRAVLQNFELVGTATTSALLRNRLGFKIEAVLSGPLGGDVQIASRVAEQMIAAVIFLVDPLNAHPHEPDIQAIQRVCNVHNIPLATNAITAAMVLAAMA